MARPCKYGCGTQLEGFDEEARKYLEAGTGGLHTKERCQEAKTKIQQKNDHGNELVPSKPSDLLTTFPGEHAKTPFVDHTAKGQQKLKLFIGTKDEVEEEYNGYRYVTHGKINVFGTQLAVDNGIIYFALNYEETA